MITHSRSHRKRTFSPEVGATRATSSRRTSGYIGTSQSSKRRLAVARATQEKAGAMCRPPWDGEQTPGDFQTGRAHHPRLPPWANMSLGPQGGVPGTPVSGESMAPYFAEQQVNHVPGSICKLCNRFVPHVSPWREPWVRDDLEYNPAPFRGGTGCVWQNIPPPKGADYRLADFFPTAPAVG